MSFASDLAAGFDSTYPSGGGYTCAYCGAFVPSGASHTCPGFTYQPAPEVRWDRMSDVRIADALERIAAALERLAQPSAEDGGELTKARGTFED